MVHFVTDNAYGYVWKFRCGIEYYFFNLIMI
jgi:hypothetical protein